MCKTQKKKIKDILVLFHITYRSEGQIHLSVTLKGETKTVLKLLYHKISKNREWIANLVL